MASSQSTAGFVERVSDFISENKRAVIIGTAAAAIAVGGVAYYASTSSRPASGDLEKGDKKDRKKGLSKTGKKKRSVKDADGPILEERKPKVDESPGEFVGVTLSLFGV